VLSDRILDVLEHDRGPQDVLGFDGAGIRTTFAVGLSDANEQQYFVHPLGNGHNRIIVRSTDGKRQLAGGLTRPIGEGCGLDAKSVLTPIQPGEVSKLESCSKGTYPKSEGITGFIDVVTVPWEQVCKHEAACIESLTRKVLGRLFHSLEDHPNSVALVMPAILTGNGSRNQDVFYTAFAGAYSDALLKAPSAMPNVIFGVFTGDWNGNGSPTSLDQSAAIQEAMSHSSQKIAINWKRDADAKIAIQKQRARFFSTSGGLLLAMSLALVAFPNFLTFDRPLFGGLAAFGYVMLSFAVAESIETRVDTLVGPHLQTLVGPLYMAYAALVGFISVVLFYIVHLAEDTAKEDLKLDVNQDASKTDGEGKPIPSD
jgi:hypothetical protein